MSLAFSLTAAAVATACEWPAVRVAAGLEAAALSSAVESQPRKRASGRPAVASLAQRCAPAVAALLTGALVLLVALRIRQELPAAACGWLVICGLPLAVIDARARRLPDALTGPCFGGVAALLIADAVADGHWHALGRAASGAIAAALFFAILAVAKPGSSGLGDAKLSLSAGALAAWFGWGVLLMSAFAAFLLAACYGLGMLAAGRASLRTGSVPFGPFLLAGCLVAVLLGGTAVP